MLPQPAHVYFDYQDGENTIEVIVWQYASGYLSQLYLWVPVSPESAILSLIDDVLALDPDPQGGDMPGPNIHANEGRIGALAERLQRAVAALETGDLENALNELYSARDKADGVGNDWISGDAALAFVAAIDEIVAMIESQA